MKRQLPKIIVVCGPTATGKSDLAVEIARALGGKGTIGAEIVSADSRQVYRCLDIGAGKIAAEEMKGVPHHLLDVADPAGRNRYTVEDFTRDAGKAVNGIIARGRMPIVCGGTGFYIDALVNGEIFPAVEPNQKLRAQLAKKTPKALMKMLAKLDPRRAREMDPLNKVRVIRAIEIAKALGSVPRIQRTKKYDALFIGLAAEGAVLRERIRARLEKRMGKSDRQGMVREAANLHKKGVSWKRMHAFGLEYRYLALYLQKKITKKEMLAALEREIYDFSRRQMTWFKRNKAISWFEAGQPKPAIRLARSFAAKPPKR